MGGRVRTIGFPPRCRGRKSAPFRREFGQKEIEANGATLKREIRPRAGARPQAAPLSLEWPLPGFEIAAADSAAAHQLLRQFYQSAILGEGMYRVQHRSLLCALATYWPRQYLRTSTSTVKSVLHGDPADRAFGFTKHHLVRKLSQNGHQVLCASRHFIGKLYAPDADVSRDVNVITPRCGRSARYAPSQEGV
jgi:hypothetical protein